MGQVVEMALLRKEFTRAQYRSHDAVPAAVFVNANSFCAQCSVVASAALTRDRVLHYLPRHVKFYSLSSHVIDIKRLFQRNKLLHCLKRCPFTEYVGWSKT